MRAPTIDRRQFLGSTAAAFLAMHDRQFAAGPVDSNSQEPPERHHILALELLSGAPLRVMTPDGHQKGSPIARWSCSRESAFRSPPERPSFGS